MPIRVYHNPDFLTFTQEPNQRAIYLRRLYLAAIVATDDPETTYRLPQHVEIRHETPGVTTDVRSRSTSVGDVQRILASRRWAPYHSLAAFCDRTRLPIRLVEKQIAAGAMGSWGTARRQLPEQLATFAAWKSVRACAGLHRRGSACRPCRLPSRY